MKRLKLFLGFSLLLVLSASLSGCIITSASPDPNEVVYMNQGESRTFRVEGPAESGLMRYTWEVYGIELTYGRDHGQEFVFRAEDASEIINKVELTCFLEQSRLDPFGNWGWARIGSKTWIIKFPQDPPIWKGDYIIEDQEDILLLNGFTEVTGDLNIIGELFLSGPPLPKVTSLESLNQLKTIGGDLYIEDTALSDLQGLNILSSVGGDVNIIHNFRLTNLKGLDSLESIGGNLIIRNTLMVILDPTKSLDGLGGLLSVGGNLEISSNDALTILNGLNNLMSVGGSLSILGNDRLTSLTELNNLTSIGGDLQIRGNYALTSLAPLSKLVSIPGDLEIAGNDSLTSLTGLNNITTIGGDLNIGVYSNLIGGYMGNNSLTSLKLDSLLSVDRNFRIRGNVILPTFLIEDLRDSVTISGSDIIICGNLDGEECP